MFPATFPRKTNMATILQIDIDGKRALALDWLNLSAFTIYGHTNDVKTICITGKNLFESLLYAKLLKISFITTKKKNVAEWSTEILNVHTSQKNIDKRSKGLKIATSEFIIVNDKMLT